MAYNQKLAERVREALQAEKDVREQKAFGGLMFMVNRKMCVNVSDNNLMCRYDTKDQEELSARKGFQPMIMKGRKMDGYCFVTPDGISTEKDFNFWIDTCLKYNKIVKSNKSKSSKK